MRALHRSVVVKKEPKSSSKGEALSLPVVLRSYPHLWSRTVGSDRKNEIANTSGRRVSRLSLRDRVRRSVIVARAFDQDASWTPPWGGVLGKSH